MKLLPVSFFIALIFVVGYAFALTAIEIVGDGHGFPVRYLRMPLMLPEIAINYVFPQIRESILQDVDHLAQLRSSPKMIGLAIAEIFLNVLLYWIPVYFVSRTIFNQKINQSGASKTPPPPPVFNV